MLGALHAPLRIRLCRSRSAIPGGLNHENPKRTRKPSAESRSQVLAERLDAPFVLSVAHFLGSIQSANAATVPTADLSKIARSAQGSSSLFCAEFSDCLLFSSDSTPAPSLQPDLIGHRSGRSEASPALSVIPHRGFSVAGAMLTRRVGVEVTCCNVGLASGSDSSRFGCSSAFACNACPALSVSDLIPKRCMSPFSAIMSPFSAIVDPPARQKGHEPRSRPCAPRYADTDQEISTSFDHLESATAAFFFLVLIPQIYPEDVSFFVSFLENAPRIRISFLVSIVVGCNKEARLNVWLADMSQLSGGPFTFLACLACARMCGRYAEVSCFTNATRTRGVGPLAHQQARGPEVV